MLKSVINNPRRTSKANEKFIRNRMLAEKGDGYIRVGTFSTELVWGKHSYVFSKLSKKKTVDFNKGMFLFGMVRRDARAYLRKHPNLKLPKKHAQIEYASSINEELLGDVTGTDLNHAYWRIAFNLGVISAKTYVKGLPDKYKAVRLAALSTVGANKNYFKIVDGKITNEVKTIIGDEKLAQIYKLIRYTCYRHMNTLKRKLGSDFLVYKTDAIYYINTPENRKMVREYFKEKDLLAKQLD